MTQAHLFENRLAFALLSLIASKVGLMRPPGLKFRSFRRASSAFARCITEPLHPAFFLFFLF